MNWDRSMRIRLRWANRFHEASSANPSANVPITSDLMSSGQDCQTTALNFSDVTELPVR